MAEGPGHLPNPAMGRDLVAGHIHKDRYGRNPAPAASHRPAGRKRVQASADRSPKRVEHPELPRLRALEAQAAAIPISSSAASSTSPKSGSSRVNPYPVGEATESSPYEIVPSVATQATQSREQGGSLELTPIRNETSPTTPSNQPIHLVLSLAGPFGVQSPANSKHVAGPGTPSLITSAFQATLVSRSHRREGMAM